MTNIPRVNSSPRAGARLTGGNRWKFSPLGSVWKLRNPAGSRYFPRAGDPRGIPPRAAFPLRLEAHRAGELHPTPAISPEPLLPYPWVRASLPRGDAERRSSPRSSSRPVVADLPFRRHLGYHLRGVSSSPRLRRPPPDSLQVSPPPSAPLAPSRVSCLPQCSATSPAAQPAGRRRHRWSRKLTPPVLVLVASVLRFLCSSIL